eukprot:COSAG02_NODE_8241_length_2645_cov_1.595051_2_plen_58_part_00
MRNARTENRLQLSPVYASRVLMIRKPGSDVLERAVPAVPRQFLGVEYELHHGVEVPI